MDSCHNIHNDPTNLGTLSRLEPDYVKSIATVVGAFRHAKTLTLQKLLPNGMKLCKAAKFLRWHNRIRYYAKVLASHAMKQTPKELGFGPEASPTVLFRYEKALYILQLVAELFAWRGGFQTEGMYKAWGTFWFAFCPWEVEQVFCVQKLFENHIFSEIGIGKSTMSETFERFLKHDSREFISLGYCSPGFGIHIILPRISVKLHSSAYDDIDLGPMRVWHYIALHGNLGKITGPRYHNFFSNISTLVSAGYALWDEIDPKLLPTPAISEMQEEVIRKYGTFAQSIPGQPSNRVGLLAFRTPTPQLRIITPQAPSYTQYLGEYCYLMSPERLAEEDERNLYGSPIS
ncbi:hypothetical protein E0Z10_g7643 [Xylaria hypoxylon]|uniref:Uncharacterized protein n=1 Tax=Xylaria hypoxylon TaxID=37992 RepID=A0A4Z0YA80_9PEZI|nr:hypothetical protein E0Z10_g7643 [Xylaria hypoxylon]